MGSFTALRACVASTGGAKIKSTALALRRSGQKPGKAQLLSDHIWWDVPCANYTEIEMQPRSMPMRLRLPTSSRFLSKRRRCSSSMHVRRRPVQSFSSRVGFFFDTRMVPVLKMLTLSWDSYIVSQDKFHVHGKDLHAQQKRILDIVLSGFSILF